MSCGPRLTHQDEKPHEGSPQRRRRRTRRNIARRRVGAIAPADIIGGSSGSPVIDDATGQVVAVNNTINEDGQQCTLNNPCEVSADGTATATKGQGYAQETYWITTCVTGDRQLDLTVDGCLLTRPNA